MAEQTTAAALLERRAAKAERAAEAIDKDPEAAHAKLERAVEPAPGSEPLTLRDVMNLFLQFQRDAMAFQMEMQRQLLELKSGAQTPDRKAENAEEVSAQARQQYLTLEAWQTEERVPVYIPASTDEQKVFEAAREWPRRQFQINGIWFVLPEEPTKPGIPVNDVVMVPKSVAEIVATSLGRDRAIAAMEGSRIRTRVPQSWESIPKPTHTQFLAGANSIAVGAPGKAGEGRVIPEALPPNPQPLGERYDAYGH